jgi:hypothetical protein
VKLTAELTAKLVNSPAFVGTEMVRLMEECREHIQLEEDRGYEINVFCAAINWAAYLLMLAGDEMDARLSDMVLLILGVVYAMGRVDERMYGPPEEDSEQATADNRGAMDDFLDHLFEKGDGKG